MKKRVTLKAIGEVQKVGYRDFVQKVARKLGIAGTVENMRDGSVQIVCEGEVTNIGKFQKAIGVKMDFIDVEKVSVVKTGKAIGKFEYFEIKYGSTAEELGERMGAGILYMGATRDEVKSSRVDIKAMHNDLKGSIDSMHSDMNTRFDTLDTKYGEIGKQLARIADHMVGGETKPKKTAKKF